LVSLFFSPKDGKKKRLRTPCNAPRKSPQNKEKPSRMKPYQIARPNPPKEEKRKRKKKTFPQIERNRAG
jgi:hypothetical protein